MIINIPPSNCDPILSRLTVDCVFLEILYVRINGKQDPCFELESLQIRLILDEKSKIIRHPLTVKTEIQIRIDVLCNWVASALTPFSKALAQLGNKPPIQSYFLKTHPFRTPLQPLLRSNPAFCIQQTYTDIDQFRPRLR